MKTLMPAWQVKEQALRDSILTMLEECTPRQREGFYKIHDAAPWKGFQHCPGDRLDESHDLVYRTVALNRAEGDAHIIRKMIEEHSDRMVLT